jgi:hypothetical protein
MGVEVLRTTRARSAFASRSSSIDSFWQVIDQTVVDDSRAAGVMAWVRRERDTALP